MKETSDKRFKELYYSITGIIKLEIEYSKDYALLNNDISEYENATPLLSYNRHFMSESFKDSLGTMGSSSVSQHIQNVFIRHYLDEATKVKFLSLLKDRVLNTIEALKILNETFTISKSPESLGLNLSLFKEKFLLAFSSYKMPDNRLLFSDRIKLKKFINSHLGFLNDLIKTIESLSSTYTSDLKNIRKPKISSSYKPDLTENQLILLFYFLRKNRILHPHAESRAVGAGLEYMTGYVGEQIRKGFPAHTNKIPQDIISCNSDDAILIIDKLSETIDSIKEYAKQIVS